VAFVAEWPEQLDRLIPKVVVRFGSVVDLKCFPLPAATLAGVVVVFECFLPFVLPVSGAIIAVWNGHGRMVACLRTGNHIQPKTTKHTLYR